MRTAWVSQRWQDPTLVMIGSSATALAVLLMPIEAVLAFSASAVLMAALVAYPARMIVYAVAARCVVDLSSSISTGPINAMEAYAAFSVVGGLFLIFSNLRSVVRSEILLHATTYVILIGIGMIRYPSFFTFTASVKALAPWVTLLLIPTLLKPTDVRRFLFILGIAAIPAVASSSLSGLFGWRMGYANGAYRLIGLYVNLTHHSIMMAVYTALLGWLTYSSRGRTRVLFGFLAAGASGCLFLTYTRAAWLGFAVTVSVYLLLSKRYRLLIFAAAIGLAVVSSSEIMVERAADAMIDIENSDFGDDSDEAGSGRAGLWRAALDEYASEDALDLLIGRSASGYYVQQYDRDPHSDPLLVLLQFGPVAVLTWVWVIFLVFRMALKHPDLSSPDADTRRFLLALCTGCIANSLVTNGIISRAGPAWLFGALMGALLLLSRPEAPARQPRPTRARTMWEVPPARP